MRSSTSILAILLGSLFVSAQDTPKLDKATQDTLRKLTVELAAAQKAEDEAEVKRLAKKAIVTLGDQAGVPEVADQFREVPKNAKSLTPKELRTAFEPYIEFIEGQKWWKVGLDPTKTNHLPRELATIIEGCLAARSVNEANAERLLKIAKEAADFLVWSQDQAGTGVIPFPAVRKGKGRPFEVAEQFMRQAEKEDKLDRVVVNGWAVEDFSDGGLQFDNGLAGVALVQVYAATKDDKYKKAAIRAADWAITRPVVTNWNYNSFSVFLLAEVYRITGDKKYLESAKKKARLGLLPGQLTEGPRKGRWADAHNARPAYHYIMVRGMAALAAVMPKDDADLPAVVESLSLALSARNPDFEKGIVNADSSVEALIRVKILPPHVAMKLTECKTNEAFQTLERYSAEGFRARKTPLGPGAWGQLLAYQIESSGR
ncbi:MAG: hypothetical protein C0467_28890 [Planctomycetaceae bacterium]|nr:hypothetical protein [Planctomycetaceae bacterium]